MSAQPDEYYFLWQIQLQLFNFNRLGIPKVNIHVLVGYDSSVGLNFFFREFMDRNDQATFYTYADTRTDKHYPSSIRPHLLNKHFRENTYLQHEAIFYHDSDIIFHHLPDFSLLEPGLAWYASDTRHYLNSEFIIRNSNEEIFILMCEIVGVSPKIVKENDSNAGGAQYFLKNVTSDFWAKVEKDCEHLYLFLKKNVEIQGICKKSEYKRMPLDPWITDMWAIWWNAILLKMDFRISPELDFCWVGSSIKEWEQKNILHYTGNNSLQKEEIFIKNRYSFADPFYADLSQINSTICSKVIVDIITEYKKYSKRNKIDLKDTTFIIPVKEGQLNSHLSTIINYLDKHLYTNIIIGMEKEMALSGSVLPNYVRCVCMDNDKTNLVCFIDEKIETTYAVVYFPMYVLPVELIRQAILEIRSHRYATIYPYTECCRLDVLSVFLFSQVLNSSFLEQNKDKMRVAPIDGQDTSVVCFIDRKSKYGQTKQLQGTIYQTSDYGNK